jgi:hypothetical protein
MEEQRQQRPQTIHHGILAAIQSVVSRDRDKRHTLDVYCMGNDYMNRKSTRYLVRFLNGRNKRALRVAIKKLSLYRFRLDSPSDGTLAVLCAYFSRSHTSITNVNLTGCAFGTDEEESQLLAAFHTNRTVTDLTISDPHLQDAALGAGLSGCLQNMPQLHRLECYPCCLRLAGARALQPGLRVNQTLRELKLYSCSLGDDGMNLVADALAGNTSIRELDIRGNGITVLGLDHVTRILESTQLQTFHLDKDLVAFLDQDHPPIHRSTSGFVRALSGHPFLKRVCLRAENDGLRQVTNTFVWNRIIEELEIRDSSNTFLGLVEITRLIQLTRLQKINIPSSRTGAFRNDAATQGFARVISRHEFLKHLNLCACGLRDQDIRIFADEFADGNTIMEVLEISNNQDISPNGRDNLTRLIPSTRIKSFNMEENHNAFSNQDATRRFARAVSSHEFMTNLNLSGCLLGDGGIHIFADELVGNTIMTTFAAGEDSGSFIVVNGMTHGALADITRLLESTRIKVLVFDNQVFRNEDATRRFVTTLRDKPSCVQELPDVSESWFPRESRVAMYASIKSSLLRNKHLNHVASLLAQPLPAQHDAALLTFKTWHKAITKLAVVPNNAGASAIFKMIRDGPALLENRIATLAAGASCP